MTKREKVAFAQGVEEGFVKAAELSGNPDAVLRQFRPVNPTFGKGAPFRDPDRLVGRKKERVQ
jgi:hypothetical protein